METSFQSTEAAAAPPAVSAGFRGRGQFGSLVPSLPDRARLLGAALLYAAAAWLTVVMGSIRLPYDMTFEAVLYLMWSGSRDTMQRIEPIFAIGPLITSIAVLALVAGAVLPRDARFAFAHRVTDRFHRYAIALPLYSLLSGNLARLVANAIYALAGRVHWDLTPHVARIEAPAIEAIQRTLGSPMMSAAAANFYSACWILPLGLAGYLFVAMDRPKAMNQLIIAYALASLLAVPIFLLLPTFDPWSTNALYGAVGQTTQVAYLYPHASAGTLRAINTYYHWAAGSALPSLHVTFPLILALLFRRHGMRALALVMTLMTATTAFVIVYLGRHWMLDVAVAIPFAFGVLRMVDRIRFQFVLAPRGATSGGQ